MARSSAYNRNNLERAFLSWGGFVVLIIILFFLGRATYEVYGKSRVAGEQRLAHMNELAELEARKANLEAELAKLQTDRGIEEELRNRFQVGKPGEEAVVVVGDDGIAHLENATKTNGKSSSTSWWKNIFRQ